MKKIKNIIQNSVLLIMVLLSFSCSKDEIGTLGSAPIDLTTSADNVDVQSNSNDVALSFNWKVLDGVEESDKDALEYYLQLDFAGNNFKNKVQKALGADLGSYELTAYDLNQLVMFSLGGALEPSEIDFRIYAKNPDGMVYNTYYSNTKRVKVSATPTYFADGFDWLTALHTRPQDGNFLVDRTKDWMQAWTGDANYHGWKMYYFSGQTWAAVYTGFGFFKISSGGYAGGVISPKMTKIPVGEHVNATVAVDVARYLNAAGQITTGRIAVEIVGDGSFDNGTKVNEIVATNEQWNVFQTKVMNVNNISSDTQFIIRAASTSGLNEFLFDKIIVGKN